MKSIMEHGKADYCYLCGRMGYLEEHHIFGGPNRKHSEALGLKVHLCPECHRDTRKGVHGSARDRARSFSYSKKLRRTSRLDTLMKNS